MNELKVFRDWFFQISPHIDDANNFCNLIRKRKTSGEYSRLTISDLKEKPFRATHGRVQVQKVGQFGKVFVKLKPS
jgi:hypothetical protein